ncbi:hypothetical protein [Dapis sp. BLCC M172]|uniref:hypothetical protein n=1 Tax=Dapis sp. BLCC M172 TaxID=2975281 RepID=UPI003CEC16ED
MNNNTLVLSWRQSILVIFQEYPAILKFVDKNLEPYLMAVTNSYVAVKHLGG